MYNLSRVPWLYISTRTSLFKVCHDHFDPASVILDDIWFLNYGFLLYIFSDGICNYRYCAWHLQHIKDPCKSAVEHV